MREIKFRAYIKEDYNEELVGKMLDVSSIHLKTGKVIIGYSLRNSNYGNKSFLYKNIELMQFTGLYDKNEKEIYEGDIIHIPEDWEEYGWASGENYEIDFKDGRFRLKPKYKPNATGYDLEFTNELEVIGNIYENPELLKGADNIE